MFRLSLAAKVAIAAYVYNVPLPKFKVYFLARIHPLKL